MLSSIKLVPLVASCALASVALAACGGAGPNAAASAAQNSEREIVKFARCMREHGVDVSTPNASGGGPIRVKSTNPQAMEAAQKACQRYQPKGGKENLSPAERAQREDQVAKFAKCMREHGVEVQTQAPGSGGFGIRIKDVNPESPGFQSAQKACERFMPKLRQARGAGGPKPGQDSRPATESSGAASGPPAGASLDLQAGK
jgi:hypothetical protein